MGILKGLFNAKKTEEDEVDLNYTHGGYRNLAHYARETVYTKESEEAAKKDPIYAAAREAYIKHDHSKKNK